MTQLIRELKRLLRLGVLLVAAALTILISLGAQNQSVTVFYQVTSGRPNPSWEISDPSQIAQLQSLISGLPSAGKGALTEENAVRLPNGQIVGWRAQQEPATQVNLGTNLRK